MSSAFLLRELTLQTLHASLHFVSSLDFSSYSVSWASPRDYSLTLLRWRAQPSPETPNFLEHALCYKVPRTQARAHSVSHPSCPAASHLSPRPFPPHCLPSARDVSSSLLIGPPAAVPAHLHSITQLEHSFHSEHQITPVPCLKHFNKFSLF